MKKYWKIRFVSLLIVLTMVLPASLALAADSITSNGRFIPAYAERDVSTRLAQDVPVAGFTAENQGGWYRVPGMGTGSSMVYVRASDLTVNGATAEPSATPTPVPTATVTLAPGVTPSPTPAYIEGEKDSTYSGTVLSYPVPVGGLFLFSSYKIKPNESNAVDSIAAGTTVKLTSPVYDENDDEQPGWYSIHYNGKTLYVPESQLTYGSNPAAATPVPSSIQSAVVMGGTDYYSEYTPAVGTTSSTLSASKKVGTIGANTRMNVRYVDANIFSFTDNGKTYYFWANKIVSGSESSGSVIGNEDVNLVTQIRLPENMKADDLTLKLYASKKTSSNYYSLPDKSNEGKVIYLNGQKVDDTWYQVSYNNTLYYVLIADVQAVAHTSQSANNDNTVATATFWVTVGANGAGYYETYTNPVKANNQMVGTISAGTNVLVGQVNGVWYSYSYNTNVYYIHSEDLASSTSTNQMSSYRILLPYNTALYDSKAATNKSSTQLPMEAGEDRATGSNYFTVQSVDASWFSIVLSGTTYYIKKSSLADNTPIEPIASTQTGKTYTITIGMNTAILYLDAACTKTSGQKYDPGTVVVAEKYTSTLYRISAGNSFYYLPASYVASVTGGDDGAATNPDNPSGSVSEIIQGEKNENYDKPVLSYRIPAGGLWLYNKENMSSRAISLQAGTVIQFSQSNPGWYTTWYGGSQYYVPESQMKPAEVNQAGQYSILLSQNVKLYKTPTIQNVTTAGVTVRETVLSNSNGITLQAGTRVNVRIYAYVDLNPANSVSVYSTTHNGQNCYFYAFDPQAPGTSYVDLTSYLDATAADNTDTKLITKFKLLGADNLNLYTYPNKSNSSVTISTDMTLFGITYDKEWYQVIYDSASWYLNKADFDATSGSMEQISIAGGATANTYTVVIGSGGASLYKSAATQIRVAGDNYYPNANTPQTLAAGTAVRASVHSGAWYSTMLSSGEVVYVQNTGIANASTDDAVRSFIIDLSSPVNLYSTISDNASPMGMKLPAGKYTMRNINSLWASVFYDGSTFYVKLAELDEDDLYDSTPVASTTVGKTYTIILGDNASMRVYNSSTLSGTSRGPLPAGYVTTGTKMYDETGGLVYQITYNGITGYISADYVVGVAEGDEVDEAKQAEKEAAEKENAGSSVAIGETVYRSVDAGTNVYEAMDSSGIPFVIPSTMTIALTKVNANWYSLSFMGQTYYLPASAVEAGSGSNNGANIAVGDSVSHSFTSETPAYSAANDSASVVATLLPNQMIWLKKISDTWYETTLANGQVVYVKASDVFLISGGTSEGTTTDGIGIITPTIMINPASGTVNLRKQPSTAASSTILARIPKGTIVVNDGYEVDANNQVWYKVKYEGKTGYVIGTYVVAVGTVGGTNNVTDATADIGRTLTVDVSSVNVRSGAGTNFGILGKLTRNTAVVPLSYELGSDGMIWYKFQYTASQVAYIRYDYLKGGVASTTELAGNVAIKAGGTNLRSGAGEAFSVKAKLPRDLIVTIVGSGTDNNNVLWYRVTVENLSGYVRSDLVRTLTVAETNDLQSSVVGSYSELKYGDSGPSVLALQNQLINIGYLSAGAADGTYGAKTTDAVKAFQKAKGLTQTGVASAATQAAIFNTSLITSGSTATLDWFTSGYSLINANPNIQVYDINAAVTWNAKYINGANHADVVPASSADAQKLKANNITGSYVRRPVIVTIGGVKYAGSMYAVGHGSTNYVSYFSGVMCIHFTGSKTHGTGNVDADHQTAINEALNYANRTGN